MGDAKCSVFTSVGFCRQDVALMVTTVGMSSLRVAYVKPQDHINVWPCTSPFGYFHSFSLILLSGVSLAPLSPSKVNVGL